MRVVTIARKPGEGTLVGNVTRHGTGGINVEACRLEGDVSEMVGRSGVAREPNRIYARGIRNPTDAIWTPCDRGRWPANVALRSAAAPRLDDEGGASRYFKRVDAGPEAP